MISFNEKLTQALTNLTETELSRRHFLKLAGAGASLAGKAIPTPISILKTFLGDNIGKYIQAYKNWSGYKKYEGGYTKDGFINEFLFGLNMGRKPDADSPPSSVVKGFLASRTPEELQYELSGEDFYNVDKVLGGFLSKTIQATIHQIGPKGMLKAILSPSEATSLDTIRYQVGSLMDISPKFTGYMKTLGIKSPSHWETIANHKEGIEILRKSGAAKPKRIEELNQERIKWEQHKEKWEQKQKEWEQKQKEREKEKAEQREKEKQKEKQPWWRARPEKQQKRLWWKTRPTLEEKLNKALGLCEPEIDITY